MSTTPFAAGFISPLPLLDNVSPADPLAGYKMRTCKSNFIVQFGYNVDEGRLCIQFTTNKFSFYEFPLDQFGEMLTEAESGSVGKFWHRAIRGKFEPVLQIDRSADVLIDGSLLVPPGTVEEVPLDTAQVAVVAELVESVSSLPAAVSLVATDETEKETQLATKSLQLSERAQAITIIDQRGYDVAAEVFAAVLAMEKEIEAEYGEMKDAAYKAHKLVCTKEKARLEPVLIAKQRLSVMLGQWAADQTRIANEAQRSERLVLEQQAAAEALELGIEAEAAGASREEVHLIVSTPAAVQTFRAVAPTTHSPAFATKSKWVPFFKPGFTEVEVRDLIIAAALENPAAYRDLLMLDMPEIRRRADKQKAAFSVPGFIARPETKATAKALKGGK